MPAPPAPSVFDVRAAVATRVALRAALGFVTLLVALVFFDAALGRSLRFGRIEADAKLALVLALVLGLAGLIESAALTRRDRSGADLLRAAFAAVQALVLGSLGVGLALDAWVALGGGFPSSAARLASGTLSLHELVGRGAGLGLAGLAGLSWSPLPRMGQVAVAALAAGAVAWVTIGTELAGLAAAFTTFAGIAAVLADAILRELLVARGNALVTAGARAAAVDAWSASLRVGCGAPTAVGAVLGARALARLGVNDVVGALSDSLLARALDPAPARPYEVGAAARTLLGRHREALDDAALAIARAPGSEMTWTAQANARWRLRDLDGAEASVSEAVRLSPDYGWAREVRCGLRAERLDVTGALEDVERMSRTPPGSSAARTIAHALLLAGRPREARELLDGAVLRLPADPDVRALRAQVHLLLGDEAAALADVEAGLAVAAWPGGLLVQRAQLRALASPGRELDDLARALELGGWGGFATIALKARGPFELWRARRAPTLHAAAWCVTSAWARAAADEPRPKEVHADPEVMPFVRFGLGSIDAAALARSIAATPDGLRRREQAVVADALIGERAALAGRSAEAAASFRACLAARRLELAPSAWAAARLRRLEGAAAVDALIEACRGGPEVEERAVTAPAREVPAAEGELRERYRPTDRPGAGVIDTHTGRRHPLDDGRPSPVSGPASPGGQAEVESSS